MAVLGSDPACLATAGTTAPLSARPPSIAGLSLCSLLPQHPMSNDGSRGCSPSSFRHVQCLEGAQTACHTPLGVAASKNNNK
eukprot:scaffold62462_cov32-Phaeocystis_antarctica.AAC.1